MFQCFPRNCKFLDSLCSLLEVTCFSLFFQVIFIIHCSYRRILQNETFFKSWSKILNKIWRCKKNKLWLYYSCFMEKCMWLIFVKLKIFKYPLSFQALIFNRKGMIVRKRWNCELWLAKVYRWDQIIKISVPISAKMIESSALND